MAVNTGVFDADGHVFEVNSEIWEYLPPPYRGQRALLRGGLLSGGGDGWNRSALSIAAKARKGPEWVSEHTEEEPTPERWIQVLDEAGIEGTVLYPTRWLGVCWEKDPEWAVAVAGAYNSWMADRYMKWSPRIKAMAVLPLQDPEAAVAELRRAITELDFVGVVLSANQSPPLGDPRYFPIYETAQQLDIPVAVHAGGPARRLDMMDRAIEARCLGHPTSQMNQLAHMMFSGVFDLFPRLRFSFMEAGVAWVLFLRDRMHEAYGQWSIEAPELKRDPWDHLRSGRIYYHCEVDEMILPYAVHELGDQVLMYACDFPHLQPRRVYADLDEFRERTDVTEQSKRRILGENAKQLYRLASWPASQLGAGAIGVAGA